MKYRKKPVVIDAVKYDMNNPNVIVELMDLAKDKHPNCHLETSFESEVVIVTTLEGVMVAPKGYYIIKGIKGELYPCEPDIFEATYEPVEGVEKWHH